MPGQDQTASPDGPSERNARRHSDSARFIERFAALTGFAVCSTSVEGLPRAFLSQTVDPPDCLVRRLGDELEPRTRNALCRFEPGRPDERWTYRRLLEIRGFGVFSLLDLLEVQARQKTAG